MAKRYLAMVHPVGLPTLLPPGQVRVSLLSARRELQCPPRVVGDLDYLPEHLSFRPITTPERFLVIGHVVWDEVRHGLAFNVVEGFGVTEGWPMIMKLSRNIFYNAHSGQVLEFNDDATESNIHQARKITGVPATRLYRMMEELVVRDKKRWQSLFRPDPVAKENKG